MAVTMSPLEAKLAQTQARKSKRIRQFTPNDRAQHRVLEKERREAFNESMQELTSHIPRIAHSQNLSKHIVVRESIKHHSKQEEARSTLASYVKTLLDERDRYKLELQATRRLSQAPLMPVMEHEPVPPEILRLLDDQNAASPTLTGGSSSVGDSMEELDEPDTRAPQQYPSHAIVPSAQLLAVAIPATTAIPMQISSMSQSLAPQASLALDIPPYDFDSMVDMSAASDMSSAQVYSDPYLAQSSLALGGQHLDILNADISLASCTDARLMSWQNDNIQDVPWLWNQYSLQPQC